MQSDRNAMMQEPIEEKECKKCHIRIPVSLKKCPNCYSVDFKTVREDLYGEYKQ